MTPRAETPQKGVPVNTGLADDLADYLNAGTGPVAQWLRSQAVDGKLSLHAPDVELLEAEARTGSALSLSRSDSFKGWLENLGAESQKRLAPCLRAIREQRGPRGLCTTIVIGKPCGMPVDDSIHTDGLVRLFGHGHNFSVAKRPKVVA